ncbi:type I 3-dehydroquinate dehydratase (plasmid) [Haloarcula sp. JP-L23]|nr:type I 3-dehydroquinate dehydratase [Haloarcula sp. JP-L23]
MTDDLGEVPEAENNADYVEFQLDKAQDPLDQLQEYNLDVPLIISNRPKWAGGTAVDSNRLDKLLAAASSEVVEMVDVELETITEHEWAEAELRENDVELIVSYHDFERTPDKLELEQAITDCAEYGDIARVATFAEKREDSLTLLECLNTASQRGTRVVGFSLGELGQHTRVIAVFYGSELCYAPIKLDSDESEYGEIELAELAELLETTVHGGDHVQLIDQLSGKF